MWGLSKAIKRGHVYTTNVAMWHEPWKDVVTASMKLAMHSFTKDPYRLRYINMIFLAHAQASIRYVHACTAHIAHDLKSLDSCRQCVLVIYVCAVYCGVRAYATIYCPFIGHTVLFTIFLLFYVCFACCPGVYVRGCTSGCIGTFLVDTDPAIGHVRCCMHTTCTMSTR